MNPSTEEFEALWGRFVAAWCIEREQNRARARELIDRALSEGLGACRLVEIDAEPTSVDAARCELAVVRRSGAVDAEGYLRATPAAAHLEGGAVHHFCTKGWRAFLNPSLEFDVWWYRFTHLGLDDDCVNPLLHYLLVGRHRGLAPVPPDGHARTALRYPDSHRVRRACLFAGFDVDGIVDDYVVDYLEELSRFADVYYLADCRLLPGELAKLDGITAGAWAVPHGKYDFGSYAMLAHQLVGRDRLATYDEVILANDSTYLLRPLDDVFARMDATACDWWGLQATKRDHERPLEPLPMDVAKREMVDRREWSQLLHLHVSSYFVVLRQPAFADEVLHRLFEAVQPESSKPQVILKYEIGLSRVLMAGAHDFATYIDDLWPYHPIYTADYFELVRRGFPLLKRNLMAENPRQCADVARWRERINEILPEAALTSAQANLERVAADDALRRSFDIVTAPDGSIQKPRTLTNREVRRLDSNTPEFEHWWAFPVCAYDHTLAGNERAVFEEVKDDPSIKKIILTRSRRVELSGENVVTAPLLSETGQWHAARAGTVFIKHSPRINVPYPLDPLRHNFINLWHGIPLKRFGWASAAVEDDAREGLASHHLASRAVITSSELDTLAMTAAFHPLRIHDMWLTGLPRNDFVVRPDAALPPDLLTQVERLRDEVAGRRLVMFLPTFKDAQADAYYQFSDAEVDWLRSWASRHNAVLGIREHMADKAHTYSTMLEPLEPIHLSSRRYPDLEVLYRVADALISDYSSCLVDFQLTGKPVVSFAYDYDRYASAERGLFYDLDQVLPGPVCRDFDALSAALDHVFDERTAAELEDYQWRRRTFFEHLDDRNAARVVRKVKELYVRDA